MSRLKTVKGVFKRPSKRLYLLEILVSFCSLLFFKSLVNLFAYYVVNYVVGRKKAAIGAKSKIHPTVIIRQGERVTIGKECLINHNNVIQAGKFIGRVIIGDYVHTGPNVMIFAFNHGMENNGIPSIKQDYWDADVVIEDDVWVGAGSVITAGVTIGKGAVIGANSVVTKDIPAFSVCGGIPAEFIKKKV